jgi:hypothetical protein
MRLGTNQDAIRILFTLILFLLKTYFCRANKTNVTTVQSIDRHAGYYKGQP